MTGFTWVQSYINVRGIGIELYLDRLDFPALVSLDQLFRDWLARILYVCVWGGVAHTLDDHRRDIPNQGSRFVAVD